MPMEPISPIQANSSVERARLRPPPAEKPPQPDAAEAKPVVQPDLAFPAPNPNAESLEGRDLADPFQARRDQERLLTELPPGPSNVPQFETEMLSASATNDVAAGLAANEMGDEPAQAAASPRSVARYQEVPRARADRRTATGATEAEPEPLAVETREGQLEDSSAARNDRAALERSNEDRTRRGSADVAGAALSAAGEQLAPTVDDRPLRAAPPPASPLLTDGPEDGVEGPEATGLEATLAGTTDVEPSSLEPRQDELRAP